MSARAAALRAQAEAHEALAAALRAEADAIGAEAPAAPASLYLPVAAFAARVALSERTIWTFVRKGMPVIGSGRGKRIDVVRADAWLAEHRDAVDSGVELQARTAARAAARRRAS